MHSLLYNENRQHVTADFPVAYYFVSEEHPRSSMPFHWHKEWEIIRVLSGRFVLSIDGREYEAGAGDAFLLRSGVVHGGSPVQCEYECLNFDLEDICGQWLPVRGLLKPFFRGEYVANIVYTRGDGAVYAMIDELLGAMTEGTQQEIRILQLIGSIYRLFAVILERGMYSEGETEHEVVNSIDRLKPVLEYVESHFSQNLSLDQLAGVIGMNAKYFCRFFSQTTQQTPMNYVNRYRVEQAAHMLCGGDLSVTEVGMECGFTDTSHFVKTFKKHKGVTPKQFRLKEGKSK